MRILEICNFSAGVCGVWTRVLEESKRLVERGHEVKVFSSRFEKGTNKVVSEEEEIKKIKIKRFKAGMPGHAKLKFLPGGESFMFFRFKEEALDFSPDVIIVHNYRQFHTTEALKIAKQLRKNGKKCKVFLVTHAPFPEGNITRSFFGKISVWFYDHSIGSMTINKFEKIFPISHWEIPFLKKIGAKKEKIVYIPNGIPDEFFSQKKSNEENKILFLGRISPKKKIETLIQAIPFLKNKSVEIEIVGPTEEEYFKEIMKIVKELNVEKRVTFSKPVYDLKEKIKKLDSCKIYVLPSRVEGMPQSLIEAMARDKIVIGSDSMAIRDLIKNNKTGFLFEFDNPKSLAEVIEKALGKTDGKIQKEAKKSVEGFAWSKVIKKIEEEISK